MSSRWNTIVRRALAGVVAVAMLAGAFTAGRASVSSASAAATADGQPPTTMSIWTVRNETVGRSLTFSGRVRASNTPGPVASSQGVVTSVIVNAPRKVKAGTKLYTVNLRPVVAGQGPVPGFRDLTRGARGADVLQLRRFLCGQGWKVVCGKSDTFDRNLTVAVLSWQKKLKIDPDGVVRSGDILWFPSLPLHVRPSETLELGKSVTGGERPFIVDAGTATFELRVSREQAALVPVGAHAVVGGDQKAVVAQVVPATGHAETGTNGPNPTGATGAAGEGEFLIELVANGSVKPICEAGAFCAEIVGTRKSVAVDVIVQTVPKQQGPAVPVAAIATDSGGQTSVRMADDRLMEVSVVAVAGGVAIVDGLVVGDRVVVP